MHGTPGTYLKEDVPPAHAGSILLLGEAPAHQEMQAGKPFSGPTWPILNRILRMVGLVREQVGLDNVCRTKLPGNNAEILYKINPKSVKEHVDFEELTHRTWQSAQRYKVVVPMGNLALRALFGRQFPKISNYRGYVLQDKPLIVPTFHPSSTMPGRSPQNFYIIFFDLHKALRILRYGRENRPYSYKVIGKKWQQYNV